MATHKSVRNCRGDNLYKATVVLLSLFLTSCLEESEHIVVVVNPIENIKSTSATTGGEVLNNGGSKVTARGVVWSTDPSPTISLPTKTSDAIITGSHDTGTGTFTSNLIGLTPGTKYYLRAYATNASGTAYSEQVEFETLSVYVPALTTTIYGFEESSATGGGDITDDGGSPVIQRGFVWDTSSMPTITLDTKTVDGSGIGKFTSKLTGLTSSTKYYVRAYATNSSGTGYGQELTFVTLPAALPSIITDRIHSISSYSAIGGGEITSDRGSPVTVRGVVWSTSPSPDISLLTKTTEGTGTGEFLSTLNGLSPKTTYYIRAYATNALGTAYGEEWEFITPDANLLTVTTNEIKVRKMAVGPFPWDPPGTPPLYAYVIEGAGGNIPDDGGNLVTGRGLEWRTDPNSFTIVGSTSDGAGAGEFTSDIAGKLADGIVYYVRAYATNSSGTVYGENVTVYIPTD